MTAQSRPLSLAAATLVNLNIMIGSGIFINTVILAHTAGAYGAVTYAAVGLLILPLMLSFSELARQHSGGSFYSYVAPLSKTWGFMSLWNYSISKLASCAVALHVSMSLLQTIFPTLTTIPLIMLDLCTLLLFTILNSFHVQFGKQVQLFFMIGKLAPILFVIAIGCITACGSLPYTQELEFHTLSDGIRGVPFVLYAFMGFEMVCGLTRALKDPERTIPRAMIIAYAICISLTTLFQWFFFCLVPYLGTLSSYLAAFPALVHVLHIPNQHLAIICMHTGIALSAAGASFGIMYANAGNFYELARRKLLIFSSFFAHRNSLHTPVRCIIAESVVVALFLIFSQGNIQVLQKLSATGVTLTYLLGALTLLIATPHITRTTRFIAFLGSCSALVLFTICLSSLTTAGIAPPICFITIAALGVIMKWYYKEADTPL